MPLCPRILRILYEQNLARNATSTSWFEPTTSASNASASEERTVGISENDFKGNTSFNDPQVHPNMSSSAWGLDSNSTDVVVEKLSWINELHLIKAVVLVVVVGILLLSTCKIVFQTFSKYTGGSGKKYEQR
jgi:hypothetical protein